MDHGPLAFASPALLIWCGLVALKLVGWQQRWRQQQARKLGQAFQAELRRRQQARPAYFWKR